ncbi:hypothetical protein BIW11_10398, partial [Tropilaelaps mercedesae]
SDRLLCRSPHDARCTSDTSDQIYRRRLAVSSAKKASTRNDLFVLTIVFFLLLFFRRMAGSRESVERDALNRPANTEGGGGGPEWLFELDDVKQMAYPPFYAGRHMAPSGGQPGPGQGSLTSPGHQGQQNCSTSCSCDTDSGYERSPAYFTVERRFEYPPVEHLAEEELDDVFYDPPSFVTLPSTPRSCAIPIPHGRQSTPSDDTVEEDDQEMKPCRPQSCPLRNPDDDQDNDDDEDDEDENINGHEHDFIDFDDDFEDVFDVFDGHRSVSTQTDWLFDEGFLSRDMGAPTLAGWGWQAGVRLVIIVRHCDHIKPRRGGSGVVLPPSQLASREDRTCTEEQKPLEGLRQASSRTTLAERAQPPTSG